MKTLVFKKNTVIQTFFHKKESDRKLSEDGQNLKKYRTILINIYFKKNVLRKYSVRKLRKLKEFFKNQLKKTFGTMIE